MKQVRRTAEYSRWFDGLRDDPARRRILARIRRLSMGNPGDARAVGGGVSEMRIHCGPGYRVYFTERGETLVVLLAGGDKKKQRKDVRVAKRLAREL